MEGILFYLFIINFLNTIILLRIWKGGVVYTQQPWDDQVFEYFLTNSEYAVVLQKGKIKTILDYETSPHISGRRGDIKLFDGGNKKLTIKKYRFRAKDYNSLGLLINLNLSFKDRTKIKNYISESHYYGSRNDQLLEYIETDVVSQLQIILKEYTRNEFFNNTEQIALRLKQAVETIVLDKSGYQVDEVQVFELNI